MPNDREAMKPTGDRQNPLYKAGLGRGRFYLETEAMWNDWCERMDEVAPEDRGKVLPWSYKEVKAVKLAKEEVLERAMQAQRAAEAAERVTEEKKILELAEVRRRLPPIPSHAPGQHPEYRRRKGQTKWSKRAVGADLAPPVAALPVAILPKPVELPRRIRLKLTAPKKPVDNGRGKKSRG